MIEELFESQQPLVEVNDITVRFGEQTVLRNINLNIPRGQTVVLLGKRLRKNGAYEVNHWIGETYHR